MAFKDLFFTQMYAIKIKKIFNGVESITLIKGKKPFIEKTKESFLQNPNRITAYIQNDGNKHIDDSSKVNINIIEYKEDDYIVLLEGTVKHDIRPVPKRYMLKIIGLFILVSMATGGLFIWSSYNKFLERSNILTKCYIYQEHNVNKFLKIDGKTYDLTQEMFPWEINQTHQNIAFKDCELIQMK